MVQGRAYATPESLPTAREPADPPPPSMEKPDPFYVEGLRCSVQAFAPLDPTRGYEQHEIEIWWSYVTTYADAMAAYLKTRTRESR